MTGRLHDNFAKTNQYIMKNILIIAILVFSGNVNLIGQNSGKIKYQETVKFTFDTEETGGLDLSGMLPDSQSFDKELIFEGGKSLYANSESNEGHEDTELSSDDGAIKIVMMTSDSEEILYTDVDNGKAVHQMGFMEKSFVVSSDLPESKWKIGTDRIVYLGYECFKASMTNEEGEDIVAWFTPNLPVSVGPSYYSQLPGAILMVSVNDGETEIKATEIVLEGVDTSVIKAPKDGKKVSSEEFEKIQEEKFKEIEEMNDGDGIMIRRG